MMRGIFGPMPEVKIPREVLGEALRVADSQETRLAQIEIAYERGYRDGMRATASHYTPVLRKAVDFIVDRYGVAAIELLGRGRSKRVAEARKALYLELRAAGLSYPEIGHMVDRDHTTILAAVTGRRGAGSSGA